MFCKKEKINLQTPTGFIIIKRSKLKAVIVEVSSTSDCYEYNKTVVERKHEGVDHHAFGDLDRLQEFYGSDIELFY